MQYTQQLTPTLTLEGLFGYHLDDYKEPEGNKNNQNMIEALGVQNDPNFSHATASLEAPPLLSVTGLSQFGTSYLGRPREINNRGFYYNGSVFLTVGAHAMKMGVNITNNRADFPGDDYPHWKLELYGAVLGLRLWRFPVGLSQKSWCGP